jgi:P4 family phage/plasmid primase-like protien
LSEQIYFEGNYHLVDAEYYASWARTSQKERAIKASATLLSNFDQVRIRMGLVDADIFKVGLDNAKQVIDLDTGQVRPATREDLITKSLRVSHLGDSNQAIRWKAFLAQIFCDDVQVIDWLQRFCGYLLTGSTSEQFFLFGFGFGANGKSVMAETIRYILGDYARAIATETLTQSKRQAGSASPDLADLIGTRLALSSETEDGAALAESLIKSLVAGDSMTARQLYSANIQFVPQFKLMMLGNHQPVIRGNDHGIWRRVRLLPFKRTFSEGERDPRLLDKLREEAPHILAWMVEGCLEWQRRGLADIPDAIRHATNQYKDDQDLIGKWIESCCILGASHETSSVELYASYKCWCLDNGLRPVSSMRLGRSLSERGFSSRRSNGKSLWSGIFVIAGAASAPGQEENRWSSWGLDD